MRKIVLLTTFMTFSLLAFSQTRTIRGKITTAEGTPVPNVTILLGTNRTVGTSSDQNGDFSINAPAGKNSLYISTIGFKDQEVKLSDKNFYTVVLEQNTETSLTEVVVVGYGTQQRKDVTGAIASVKGDDLKDIPTPSIDKALQGQVAGLQASVPSGILGQAARIRIRGTNSISSSSDPLYVVDGVPYISGNQGSATPYNPISDLNPSDIATIDVLKDGAATAIYGSRAANGVVLITTKRGKVGKPTITYDGWVASARASKRFDLLNADQFIEIANEKFTNYGDAGPAKPGTTGTTDWQGIILRNATQQSHALTLSGASDQTNYFLSLGYANMEGITVSNALTRYNIRAKVEQKALDNHLSLGANIAVTYNINNGLNTGSNALSGNIGGAIRLPSNVSPYNSDGTFNLSPGGTLGAGPNGRTVDDNYTNLAYILANNVFKSQALNVNGLAFAKVRLMDGLNLGTQIGINYVNVEDFWYYNPVHGDGRGPGGVVDQAFSPTFRYNWQNTVDYTKRIEQHLLNMVIGQELQKTRFRFLEGWGQGLSDVFFGQQGNIISSTLKDQFYNGSISENAFLSYFGRVNYSFADKYLLSASIRNDKLSALPWANQSAVLPGASIGWRLSKESFWGKGIANVISDAKIRASYAKVGNVDIGNYPYAGTFGAIQYGDWSGVQYNRMANPDLRFETSKKTDVGLDLSFLKNRVQLVADYFVNDIDNLILSVPTPPSLGVPNNNYSANVGKMVNKGWEFSVNSSNIEREHLRWSTAFNISFVNNKVTALVDNKDIINTYNITRVGLPIGSFFGYQYAGVNTQNGNPLFLKADGSLVQFDGSDDPNYGYYVYDPANPADESTPAVLNAADKRVLGQSNPKYYGGFTNNFYYRGFDLGIVLTFAGGHKIYNITRQESLSNQKFQNNGTEMLRRWTTVGQVTDVPKLWYFEDNTINLNGNLNSRFLEKADFLRGQTITLGYSFNMKKSIQYINSLRLYAQMQNAFIFTKYSGLDPELANSVTTNQTPGLDYNTNPVPRTFSVGLNVNFQ